MMMKRKQALEILASWVERLKDPAYEEAVDCLRSICTARYEEPPNCGQCGRGVTDDYMLTNTVWFSVWNERKGYLHLRCVEKRLGRPLNSDDFTDVPINQSLLYFARRCDQGENDG